MMTYFGALLSTLAIELLIVAALAPSFARRHVLGVALALNLFTHPLAWLAVAYVGASWASVEGAVTLTECALYRCLTGVLWPRAALLACAANGVTAAVSFMF